MTAPARFRSAYVNALGRHVLIRDEATLRSGYELGRSAVAEGVSALDLAMIHHEALSLELRATDLEGAEDVIVAAAAFFREILSAFEMVHRGYREATSAAASERHNAVMLRRLSSFLTDSSLSAREGDVAAEVLHLVADHARELTAARCCAAWWGTGSSAVRAASFDDDALALGESSVLRTLERVAAALASRVSRAEWAEHPALREVGVVSNVLTVPLSALDGRVVGRLQLLDKGRGDFTPADEAVAVQLADMAAAALERAELYASR